MFEYLVYERIFFLSVIIILFTLLLINNSKNLRIEIFLDNNFKKPQSFHTRSVLNIGGIIILFYFILAFFFFEPNILPFKSVNFFVLDSIYSLLKDLIIGLTIVFSFSVLEDLKINLNPIKRFLIQFILIFLIVITLDVKVYSIQFYTLDKLLNNNEIISFIFTSLCILFILNGANFLDGFNGLLAIHSIIITFCIIVLNAIYQNIGLLVVSYLFLLILSIFLFFNFPVAKIFLGNSGSNLVGFTICFLILKTSNLTQYHKVYPFFFANLLYLIFFEVFFSFFRKLVYEKKNPFLPDKKHLHMLLFKKCKSHYKTSLTLNGFFLISLLPLIMFYSLPGFLKIYFFILIILYLVFYFILLRNYKD